MAEDRSAFDDDGVDQIDAPIRGQNRQVIPAITIPTVDTGTSHVTTTANEPAPTEHTLPTGDQAATSGVLDVPQNPAQQAIAAERQAARKLLVAQGQHAQRLVEEQQRETQARDDELARTRAVLAQDRSEFELTRQKLEKERAELNEQLEAAHRSYADVSEQLRLAEEQHRTLSQQLIDERAENEQRLTRDLVDQEQTFQRRFAAQSRTLDEHVEALHSELDELRGQLSLAQTVESEHAAATLRATELAEQLSTQTDQAAELLEHELALQATQAQTVLDQALADQAAKLSREFEAERADLQSEIDAQVALAREEERARAVAERERVESERGTELAQAIERDVKQRTLAIELRTQAAELRGERLSTQLEQLHAERAEERLAAAQGKEEFERRLESALEAQGLRLTNEHSAAIEQLQAQAREEARTAFDSRISELESLFAAELAQQADELTRLSSARLQSQAENFEKVLSAELSAQAQRHETEQNNHTTFASQVADESSDQARSPNPGRLEDLTGQVVYLRSELRRYRQLVESDRIEHTRQLLAAQESADGSYGTAQVEFSRELQRYATVHANALIKQQVEFENALAQREQDQDLALERMHEDYLDKLRQTREHAESKLAEAKERFSREIADVRAANRHASTRRQRAAVRSQTGHDEDLEQAQSAAALAESERAAIERDHLLLVKRFEQLELDAKRREETLGQDLEQARRSLVAERNKIAAERTEWLRKSAVLAAQADDSRRAQQSRLAAERADMQARLDEAEVRFRAAIQGAEHRLLIATAREADLESQLNRARESVPPPS